MRVYGIAAAWFVLLPVAAAPAETQPCCQRVADDGGPLEPIPDPSTWQQPAASPSPPSGLQPGDKYHVIFATSFQTAVDSVAIFPPAFPHFGSLEAADWIVTFAVYNTGQLPDWNTYDLIYTAILSTAETDARDRLTLQGPLYNTRGDLIATGEADLWDGAIANPVGYDEFGGEVVEDAQVWTGTNTLGYEEVDTCVNWTNPSSFDRGQTGIATEANNWLSITEITCNCTARLYGVSPAITYVPEPSTLVLLLAALVSISCCRRGAT